MAAAGGRWMARKLAAAKRAIHEGVVNAETPAALLLDGQKLASQATAVQSAFAGAHFNHAFAVKSNPTLRVLQLLGDCGMGMEAASHGELAQALRAGVPADRIVYDCPVKTEKDMVFALDSGVDMNVDNFQELYRLDELLQRRGYDGSAATGVALPTLGVRLNPQVGAGAIASHATATMTSKFGIGMQDRRADLVQAYIDRPWLTMAHVHVGSQGIALDLSVAGMRAVFDFCAEVNARVGRQQITKVDIGGGLSVNFASEAESPTFDECAGAFRGPLPEIFSGEYQITTEYGRAITAKAGFALSRVEFNKVSGGRPIALQHIGADLVVRTIYHPETWPLRITALDRNGNPRDDAEDKLVTQDVAGPCCIQSDVIAHQRPLPLLEAGDWIMVHDIGGYMHASYSCYNARQCPPVLGFGSEWARVADDFHGRDAGNGADASDDEADAAGLHWSSPSSFAMLQQGQTVEDTLSFFSHKPRAS